MRPVPSDAELAALVRGVLPDAVGAWLFGSAARGRLRPDSDLDIAVWRCASLSAANRFDAAQRLALQLGRDVDLLDFHRLPTLMQAQVIGTGRRLFTDSPVAEQHTIAMVMRDYQDLQARRQPMVRALRDRLLARAAP